MEGRCSQRERTISRRYRHHEGSARVSGGEQIARRGCTLKARNWGGGIVDRSVTSSRNPTQPNRDGGSGCYPRVREENVWRLGEKGGRPSTECLWQVVGRGFSGNGGVVTVAVEMGRVGIARCAPAGRRGTETGWLGENPSYWKEARSTSVETVTQGPVGGVEGRRVVVGLSLIHI